MYACMCNVHNKYTQVNKNFFSNTLLKKIYIEPECDYNIKNFPLTMCAK